MKTKVKIHATVYHPIIGCKKNLEISKHIEGDGTNLRPSRHVWLAARNRLIGLGAGIIGPKKVENRVHWAKQGWEQRTLA